MTLSFEDFNQQRRAIDGKYHNPDPKLPLLMEAAGGLATEATELFESVYKSQYRSKDIDVTNIKEELGDLMWYIGDIIKQLELNMSDILEMNIEKLNKIRYKNGNGFNPTESDGRDTKKERKYFESVTPRDIILDEE